jgi:hypothetical protein
MLGDVLAPTAPRPTTMKRPSIRAAAALIAVTVAVIAALTSLLASGAPRPPHAPQSIFQDDDHLLYADRATVARTLSSLKALGVDRIRVTIEWAYLAPDPTATTEPAGFDAADPADYPRGAWKPYDRVVKMARARGIGVDFNVTDPGPLWAMAPASVALPAGTTPTVYDPAATAFGQFVQALGTRYSGTYVPVARKAAPGAPLLPSLAPSSRIPTAIPAASRPLPRVDFWSIWNEPNQPGWLAPQWRTVRGRQVPDSPRLYRALVDAAVRALEVTGHTASSDTILVGETAPEGDITAVKVAGRERYDSDTGSFDAMTPMVFVRALYCVSSSYRPLTGAAASALGCPTSGSARAFVSANPGLFYATGFAHHPYYFLFAPNVSSPVADFVPLANLARLERGLDRAFAAYGVKRKIPIYLTEYGYETNPPNPSANVSPAEQAAYLNEADYMAWRDPRVRSVTQFLLYDSGPNTAYPPTSYDYWGSTFQTGLIYGPGTPRDGTRKPAYAAYRLPMWIPATKVRRGSKMLIWGMLRLAPKDTAEQALIEWRPAGGRRYRTIATAEVPASAVYGYFTTRITPPGRGSIRIAWRSPTGETFTSRTVSTMASPSPPATGTGAFAMVQNAFDSSATQTLPPCEFSAAELAQAQSSVPNNDEQYNQNLVAAIDEARQERADGACSVNKRAATTTPTALASTPVPPPAPPLGQNARLPAGSATAASDWGLPAPVAILIVLCGLLVVPAVVLGTARARGWAPPWAARLRHSWAEAGYRVAEISSAVGAWIRRE